jgi:DNA-binding IclR family transcriptional regulator
VKRVTTKSKDKQGDKPLERYIRILEVVSGFSNGISLGPIAEMLGLPKATAHRLITGLVETGMLEQVDRGVLCYQVGPRFGSLLYAGATDEWIRIIGQPLLKDLAVQTDQACFIAKLAGNAIRSAAMVAPDNQVRAYVVPGQEIVPHAGATAKAILAHADDSTLSAVLPSPLPRLTANTKTSRKALAAEFAEIRRTGVALCIGEDIEGFAGVAVPVVIPGRPVNYSIGLTGTIDSLITNGRELHERRLKAFAAKLATAIEAQLPGNIRRSV